MNSILSKFTHTRYNNKKHLKSIKSLDSLFTKIASFRICLSQRNSQCACFLWRSLYARSSFLDLEGFLNFFYSILQIFLLVQSFVAPQYICDILEVHLLVSISFQMGNDPKANTSTASAVVNEQIEHYKWKVTDKVREFEQV